MPTQSLATQPRARVVFALALWAIPTLSGCQKLIGLDGRVLEHDSGMAALPEPDCVTYCNDVNRACSGDNDTFVDLPDYGSDAVCLAVCQHFDKRADPEGNHNTLSCRKNNAHLAANLNAFERATYCPAAGPGGGAPGSLKNCGNNCEGYCSLYQAVCDPALDRSECERQCGALHDNEVVNADEDFAQFPDTIQCRLAHLSVAAYADPKAHCVHARLVPAEGDSVSCDLSRESAPSCADYCKLVGVACRDGSAVYESEAQCLAVCNALPAGTAKEVAGNSVACRRWRAYAALLDPGAQCGNAGPASAAPCGDPCETYCDLVQQGCAQAFGEHFAAGAAACVSDCRTQEFAGTYTLAGAKDNGLACRLLFTSRALAGEPGACSKALGLESCE